MRISILVAAATNGVIGRDGDLPWHISDDLKNFKRLTMGHPILMGRKTLQSIGRLLPGRTTIVLTRNRDFQFNGALIAHDWDTALARAAENVHSELPAELFIVGGAEIYRLALPHADRIYLTQVNANVEGDTRFPEINHDDWVESSRKDRTANDKNEHDFSFLVLDRKPFPNDQRDAEQDDS